MIDRMTLSTKAYELYRMNCYDAFRRWHEEKFLIQVPDRGWYSGWYTLISILGITHNSAEAYRFETNPTDEEIAKMKALAGPYGKAVYRMLQIQLEEQNAHQDKTT